MAENHINILCSSDDGYSQHCGVMLCSLLENASNPEKIRVYLLDGGISEKNKKKIKKIGGKYGSKISIHKINDKRLNYFNSFKGRGNICNYLRLFLENIFKEDDVLVYLDSDIIVEGDVTELKKFRDDENILYAVSEGDKLHKKNYSSLGMENEEYFNSGVLVINTSLWKRENILKKVIKTYNEKKNLFEFNDQDPLNIVLKGKWGGLPPEWNVLPLFYSNNSFKEFLKINKREIKKIRRYPKIIHYCEGKPWKYGSYHPKKEEYWKYLKKTPWKNYKYEDKTIYSFLNKTYGFVKFNTPYQIKKMLKKIK